jgi:hypothetical protein
MWLSFRFLTAPSSVACMQDKHQTLDSLRLRQDKPQVPCGPGNINFSFPAARQDKP